MVFFGVSSFEVLMLLWFLFGVSAIVAKVLKMLVFPSFGGFCGVGYSCLFGFGRFRWFGVLVFGFLSWFCFCFLFCLCFVVGLFLVLVLVLLLFFFFLFFLCFCFCFFVFVFLFLFFLGFKGQVRWPFGPPHLALNPPYVFFFVFLSLFLIEKSVSPPQKKAILVYLCLFPFVSL